MREGLGLFLGGGGKFSGWNVGGVEG